MAGLGSSLVTAAAYAPGLDRSLTYDAAETVGFFVLAPSAPEALTRQRSFNNHPVFSFIEHLIVRASGRSDDWLLRLLPIGLGALTVGVLVWALTRRFGLLAGAAGGLVLATNPMFVELSRDVRGYSLLTLTAVVTTLLHLRLVRSWERHVAFAYVITAVIGLMTHFLLGVVVLAHAVDVLGRGAVRLRWLAMWGGAGALAASFYAFMLDEFLDSADSRGRIFRPAFPADLAREVLGHEPVAVVLIGALTAAGLLRLTMRPPVAAFAATTCAVALLGWLAAPENLAPRFFVWAVPGVAALAAAAVAAKPRIGAVAVGVAAISAVAGIVPGYTESRNRYHDLAQIIDRAERRGETACVTDLSVPPMLAYTQGFEVRTDPTELDTCSLVVIAEPRLDREYVSEADGLFRHRLDLFATDPALVFAHSPIRPLPPRSEHR